MSVSYGKKLTLHFQVTSCKSVLAAFL
uniref:Uncharacterized protein n=1 Tax=Rhizophora mucronata TaxID=61149 RepID=A0A2P2Q8D1_RHIMU